MGRLVAAALVTLDGVVEAPERWAARFWSDDARRTVVDLLRAVDALLVGPGTADALDGLRIPADLQAELDALPRHVVPSASGSAEARSLREAAGGPVLLLGSPALLRGLLAQGLVDELRLLLAPVVVGAGARLFPQGSPPLALDLAGVMPLNGGLAVLRYHAGV